MAVPNTFGTATSAIPLSQLDANFETPITIGNTAVQLGNTVTTLNNMTLANVTISSGTITITNVAVTTANVSGTANISTLVVVGNETVGGNTTITGNITAANANVTTNLVLSNGTANGVAYLNGTRVLTTGSALVFDGTNLGIGTSSPGSFAGTTNLVVGGGSGNPVLTLYGGASTYSGVYFADGVSGSDRYRGFFEYNHSTDSLAIGTAASTKATLDTSGNLGLGVTPSAWNTDHRVLQIKGGVTLSNDGGNSSLRLSANVFVNSSSENRYIATAAATRYRQTSGAHFWDIAASGTAGDQITFTQAMTLDDSGNLLVGATSAVLGGQITCAWDGNVKNGMTLNETGAYTGATFAYFSASGTACGNISRVALTNAVVYNTTSDYRLKTVIGAVSGQGERIDALKPIDYQWKDGGQQVRGFLAHEFKTVYPNSVTGEKDAVDADGNPKYQAMQAATSEVIADLVAEIQSLRKRLAAANL